PVGQPDAAPARSGVVLLDRQARGIRLAQLLERVLGVHVGAVLGEDREDQLRRRVPAALPGVVAVQSGELVEGEADEAGPGTVEALPPGEIWIRLASGALLRL